MTLTRPNAPSNGKFGMRRRLHNSPQGDGHFYLCLNEEVPATEAARPTADTVPLGTEDYADLTTEMKKYFSTWDIDMMFASNSRGALQWGQTPCGNHSRRQRIYRRSESSMKESPTYLLLRSGPEGGTLQVAEDGSPYSKPGDFTKEIKGASLPLTEGLLRELSEWRSPPCGRSGTAAGGIQEGEASGRRRIGIHIAQRVARELGPMWVVQVWDARHQTMKAVCWQCPRLHWMLYEHSTPPAPKKFRMVGEFKYGPLRSDDFGDFFPDDPAAFLSLSMSTEDALYAWARDVDDNMELWLQDRDDGAFETRVENLDNRGLEIADRITAQIPSTREFTFVGVL
ncbi:hypothetical protein [Streptomyces sp. NPDC047046]|uniref:hypothetical protein n=1 Tax=Streptomyces sp. NPDC047046 TaxID=3155378 RepID=UPI0033E1A914